MCDIPRAVWSGIYFNNNYYIYLFQTNRHVCSSRNWGHFLDESTVLHLGFIWIAELHGVPLDKKAATTRAYDSLH